MMEKKILVVGYFGYKTNQLDGQTVKTRNIYELFLRQNQRVNYIDTQTLRSEGFISLFNSLKKIITCNIFIYLPAHNNLKYLFPLFFILSKCFRFKIIYIVVGGWLVEFISNKPLHRFFLKNIFQIFTENQLMNRQLSEKYKIFNSTKIPNFRYGDFIPKIKILNEHKLKIVFMARINKKKGLDIVFSIADLILKNKYHNQISIDFYGPINQEDNEYFKSNLNKYDFICYNGVIQPDTIPNTLNNYDILLFPTHYYTEGFPGSILDSYRAGIPVIVSKWKHADEFVIDGETGFIVPFDNNVDYIWSKIIFIYNNPRVLFEMKNKAYIESLKYTSEVAWEIISSRF
ncbi:MAG: glycosyltransferase [Bacteroidetes bacterium]|nr:glycosyltransferase [Bacteroidota bacterium]